MLLVMPEKYTISDEQAAAFQQLIKSRREQRGKTQIQAAEQAGVSQQLISALERGPTPGVRAIELGLYLKWCGISPNEAFAVLGLYEYGPSEQRRQRYPEIVSALDRLQPEQLEYVMRAVEALIRGFDSHTLPLLPGAFTPRSHLPENEEH